MTDKFRVSKDREAIMTSIVLGYDFDAGNMSGANRNTWATPRDELEKNLRGIYNVTTGTYTQRQLKGYTLDTWVSDGLTNHVDYVVWSYAEPIAWHVNDGEMHWVIVKDRFSATTSRHQDIVREVLSLNARTCIVGKDGWVSEWVPERYGDNDHG